MIKNGCPDKGKAEMNFLSLSPADNLRAKLDQFPRKNGKKIRSFGIFHPFPASCSR